MARFAPKYVADEGNIYADSDTVVSMWEPNGMDILVPLEYTRLHNQDDKYFHTMANSEYLTLLCAKSPDARASLVMITGVGWTEWFYRANLIRSDKVQAVIERVQYGMELDEDLTCEFELADLCESMQPYGGLNTRVMRDTGTDNPYLAWCAIDYCVINGWFPDGDGIEGESEHAANYPELIEMINDVSVQDVVATRMTYS